jgi:hypothetical protein
LPVNGKMTVSQTFVIHSGSDPPCSKFYWDWASATIHRKCQIFPLFSIIYWPSRKLKIEHRLKIRFWHQMIWFLPNEYFIFTANQWMA